MTIPKPLSSKTLEKKYRETNISAELLESLQKYFLCFSNLYGILSLKEAFDIYSYYEPEGVKKVKFRRFAEVVARDIKPYVIIDVAELYDEKPGSDYLLINRKLITEGYYKWLMVYKVVDSRQGKPFYRPEKKEFLKWQKDRFWEGEDAIRFRQFIENLRTSGIRKHRYSDKEEKLTDIEGKPASGKKLSQLIVMAGHEQFEIDYCKKETAKRKPLEKYSIPVSEKILKNAEISVRAGTITANTMAYEYTLDMLIYDYGVELTQKQLQKFMELYMQFNNRSNSWQNSGYSPEELRKELGPRGSVEITFGSNIRKMINDGEYDVENLKRTLIEQGIKIDDKDLYS